MKKFVLFLFCLIFAVSVQAQIFGHKMPVGVKSYQITKDKFPLVFLDVDGAYDPIDFQNLDSTLKAEEGVIVFDRKKNVWRLPLTYNEATGVADKDGEEPLQRLFFVLGEVRPALRQRIEN